MVPQRQSRSLRLRIELTNPDASRLHRDWGDGERRSPLLILVEEEEEGFYTLPSYYKNGHVVVREALLVHHREHKSLSDSGLVFSDCKALRRTTRRVCSL